MKIIVLVMGVAVTLIVSAWYFRTREPQPDFTEFDANAAVPLLRTIHTAQTRWHMNRGSYAKEYSDLCFSPLNSDGTSNMQAHFIPRRLATASADKTTFPDGSSRKPIHGAYFKNLNVPGGGYTVIAIPAEPKDLTSISTYAVSDTATEPFAVNIDPAWVADEEQLINACGN